MSADRLRHSCWRWLGKLVLAVGLLGPSTAMAQSKLRVDADAVAIPETLQDAWNDVLTYGGWSSRRTGSLGVDAAFSRFLPRSYEIQRTGNVVRIVTRWVARGNCESMVRTPTSLGVEKKKALEDALGQSINDLADAGEAESGSAQRVTVLWCQFRTSERELVPFTELSDSDQRVLQPFADLALSRLDLAVGPDADCDSSPTTAGRSRRGSSRSRSRSGGASMPAGSGGVSGVLPTGATAGVSGSGGKETQDAKLQKFGVLIEEFRSRPGSLAFDKVRDFTRCIRARTPEEALARAAAGYPVSVAGADGERISFRVSLAGTNCNSGADSDGSLGDSRDDSGDLSPSPDPIGGFPGTGSDSFPGSRRGSDPYSFDDIPFADDYDDFVVDPNDPYPLIDDSDLSLTTELPVNE